MILLTKWNPLQTARWNPFLERQDFERRLGGMFGRTPQIAGNGDEAISLAAREPLADITEDEKESLVKIEVPGMKEDDVKVTVKNGTQRISGERKWEKKEQKKK